MIFWVHPCGDAGMAGIGKARVNRGYVQAVRRAFFQSLKAWKMLKVYKVPAGQGIKGYNDKVSVFHRILPSDEMGIL